MSNEKGFLRGFSYTTMYNILYVFNAFVINKMVLFFYFD